MADALILPDAIPCALTPDGQVVNRTYYTKTERYHTADVLVVNGYGQTVLHCHDKGRRVMVFKGLPCVGDYDNGAAHPYYSLESLRTSQPGPKRNVVKATGILAVPDCLADLARGVVSRGKNLKKPVAPLPALVLGRSGCGRPSRCML